MISHVWCGYSIVESMADYSSDRTQFYALNKQISDSIPYDYIVLRGSILSPFLFSHHVKEPTPKDSEILLEYTDDFISGNYVT